MMKRSHSVMNRFRSLLLEREENGGISSIGEIVRLYEIVLSDLTSNSKPAIGDLTMIARDYKDHATAAQGIADAICARILYSQVPADQKLFSLYLLDSIVKNIGFTYVRYFASRLPEMFCETYKQVHPEFRPSMRRLFGTWSAIFPPSVLHRIETELQFSAPISQHSSDVNAYRSGSPRPAHGIHVNPKYLEARRQFEHSIIDDIHETDPREISGHKEAIGRKRKERNASASPKRWSGASLTSHNSQDGREISSSLQLYGQNPTIAYNQYDADRSKFITSGVGSQHLGPRRKLAHGSSIVGADKLLSSKSKLLSVPNHFSRTGPVRSLSPSVNEMAKEKFPRRALLLQPRVPYEPSSFKANDGKDNFFGEYHPDDGHQLLPNSGSYNLSNKYDQHGPRALIDAYGNDRGKTTLDENPLKVDINISDVADKAEEKRRWQNNEEDEYMWEDMSPTLANQRNNDLVGVGTKTSLEMLSASLPKPDSRRGSWELQVPPSMANNSATTAENNIPILGSGVGSVSGQGSQYANIITESQGSHYSQQPWETRRHLPQSSHHSNAKTDNQMSLSMTRVTSSATQDMSFPIDKTLDTEAHFQRLSHVMSRTESLTSDPTYQAQAFTNSCLWGRPQSPPEVPLTFPPVNVNSSHPQTLHPSFKHQKQIEDNVVVSDVHKPLIGQAQLPYRQPELNTLNQDAQRQAALLRPHVRQPLIAHESFIPSVPAEISSSLITQRWNHGHDPNILSATTRSVVSNTSVIPSSSLVGHWGSDTSLHAHKDSLHQAPVGSLSNQSQMGTTSQNMGPAAHHLTDSNAFSGLINSLVAQGLISAASSAPVQVSMGVEFNPDLLKVRHESAIKALYGDLPRKCTTCGLRFKCQEKHSSHMDWHVTKNRVSKNCKQKSSRKWFVNTSLWLSGAEAAGSSAIPGFWTTETDIVEKVEKEIAVPADENQDACALCGEPFDDFYCDETEEWMYRGALYLNGPNGSTSMDRSQLGPIVHAKCRSDTEVTT